MGSIASGLFGSGSKQKSAQSSAQTTTNTLTKPYQQYSDLMSGILSNYGDAASSALGSGLASVIQGNAPTSSSIASDISAQTNPYNQSVIDTINRQATGQGSVLKSQLGASGALGSNRQALGANDIDTTRTQQIGNFLTNQYNTALQNALTTMPSQRRLDTQQRLGALSGITSGMGILPSSLSSTTTGKTTGSTTQTSTPSNWSAISNILPTVGTILSFL